MVPRKLIFWNAFFVAALLTANVMAGKIVQIGVFVIPSAVIAYAFMFLGTDMINELFGREEARRTIKLGLIMQVMCTLIFLAGQYLPVAPFAKDSQWAYVLLLGQNWRVVIASLVGYYISQLLDVTVFHAIKQKTGEGKKWLRTCGSTALSSLIDTMVFIFIAFLGTVPNVVQMILSQYFIKFLLSVLEVPVFYGIMKLKKRISAI